MKKFREETVKTMVGEMGERREEKKREEKRREERERERGEEMKREVIEGRQNG